MSLVARREFDGERMEKLVDCREPSRRGERYAGACEDHHRQRGAGGDDSSECLSQPRRARMVNSVIRDFRAPFLALLVNHLRTPLSLARSYPGPATLPWRARILWLSLPDPRDGREARPGHASSRNDLIIVAVARQLDLARTALMFVSMSISTRRPPLSPEIIDLARRSRSPGIIQRDNTVDATLVAKIQASFVYAARRDRKGGTC